jgi:hypothetical protein
MRVSTTVREDVQESLLRCYRALDDHSHEGFAAPFLPDGIFRSRYGDYKGRTTVAEFIREHIAQGREDGARHFLSNFLFETADDGGVLVRCYLVKMCFEEAKVWTVGTSRLAIHYRQVDGKWQIALFELAMDLKSPQRKAPY